MKEISLQLRSGYLSVSTAITLFGLKLYYGYSSHSIGVLASAVDSAFDTLSSAIILLALIAAAKPADHDHRYGHGKAEALAGFFQSIIIIASAIFILYQSGQRFFSPVPLENIHSSIMVMFLATSVTVGTVAYQTYVANQTGSIAVKADRLHYLTDIASNLVVIISLLLENYLNIQADFLAGIFLGLYIIKSGIWLLKESFDVLMDRDISDIYRSSIQEFIEKNSPQVLGYHDLRSRSSGNCHFLEFHLEMDRSLSFEESHSLVESLINFLTAHFASQNYALEITVHSDPARDSNGTIELSDNNAPRFY